MKTEEDILQAGDAGPYGELAAKNNPQDLVIVYIPALSLCLKRAETHKGRNLSSQEIDGIKAKMPAMAVPRDIAEAVISDRGGIE